MKKPLTAIAAALTIGLGALFLPGSASAERVTAANQDDATIATCPYQVADVERWDASKDTPVSFIADQYVDSSGGLIIGIGYDDEGFWSARSDSMDACDSCNALELVHTAWSGAETTYEVVSSRERSDLSDDRKATRDLARARLFALAKQTWPVTTLHRDYQLTTPQHDASGNVTRFTGWFADVQAGSHQLRFAMLAEKDMCWCHGRWQGYALAKP